MEWEVLLSAGIGGLVGAVISPWLSHFFSMKRLAEEHKKKIDYLKEEIIFKRLLTHVEEIFDKMTSLRRVVSNRGGIIFEDKFNSEEFESLLKDYEDNKNKKTLFYMDYKRDFLYGLNVNTNKEINNFNKRILDLEKIIAKTLRKRIDGIKDFSKEKKEFEELEGQLTQVEVKIIQLIIANLGLIKSRPPFLGSLR